MVKKIIACSDIHIRNLRRLDETYEVLDTMIGQIREIASEYEKDEVRIVVAGDIFEQKITISNEGNLAASWFFRELNDIAKTIVICGNHDYLANNVGRVDSLTQLFNIGNFDNTVYLDEQLEFVSGTFEDDNIVWCLYSTFDGFSRPFFDEMINSKEYDGKRFVGLIHGDVNGAVSDSGYVSDKGVDPSAFKGLDFVIAGHIHKHQEIKKNGVKIVYCSSPVQQNNGESVHGHGFVVWDVEDCSYEFVEVKNKDYGFYKFKIGKIEDIENDKEVLINL